MEDYFYEVDPTTGDMRVVHNKSPLKVEMIRGTDLIDPDILRRAMWLGGYDSLAYMQLERIKNDW